MWQSFSSWPLIIATVLALDLTGVNADERANSASPRVRKFRLDYLVTLQGLEPDVPVRVWLPQPQSTEDQSVSVLPGTFPAATRTGTDATYGNRMVYFEAAAPASGSLSCETSYRIERRELRGLPGERAGRPVTLSDAERKLHLSPNVKIPLAGRPQQLLAGTLLPKEPLALGRLFYDRVDDHVTYDKSRPGYGNGDAVWVCDSRFGNCTDFHSLFIAWARAHGLPARFEIGFPLPDERGRGEIPGYHCWAHFYADGHGWTPVDISEADKIPAMKEYYFGHLTENRVTFTVGRDLDLVPRQAAQPLNFFVYPYAEVKGQPLAKDQVKLTVRFADE